jgi:hypothetical protein
MEKSTRSWVVFFSILILCMVVIMTSAPYFLESYSPWVRAVPSVLSGVYALSSITIGLLMHKKNPLL